MKLAPVLLLFVLGAQASWFGSNTPAYQDWGSERLAAWLKARNVPLPATIDPPTHKFLQELVKKHWNTAQDAASDAYDSASSSAGDAYDTASQYSQDAYNFGQQVFQSGREQAQFAFDHAVKTWDDSKLRQYLLDQGVIEPNGPREQLEQLARQKYREILRTMGSTTAYVAQTTQDFGRKAMEDRDWVYSSWDDSELRAYLVDKGLLKSKEELTREQMIKKFQDYYHSAVDPVYEFWSDSFINEWLYQHNIPPFNRDPPPRATLVQRMRAYYYDVTQYVWNTWTESDLRAWLISRNIIKSDAQITREKLERLVADNYLAAQDTIWSSWRDADIRGWLVEHDIVSQEKADKMTRAELEKTISARYNDASERTADYLVWPDARLRAYLREHGIPEEALPTSRPGLLQETRIRWVQARHRSDALYDRVMNLLAEGRHIAEEKLHQIISILTGKAYDAADYASGAAGYAHTYANEKARDAGAAAAKAKKEL
ncbi:hypothetical protein K488DRAFT_90238 [Vararia minispora EC-137]|uniref:Uncharacterized protein n=1 Tax=Vararia minispora EC-137 TaxID=1314806 RepID=A0ACB8Q848_9AGAM|nr:hypothetical protein K488DRAFT_90238 [Vararia minispora EC-137]